MGACCGQVLVHAGTGGVGLAAINVARAMGCRVFSTAGSAQKRSLLRSLGAQAAASSRDTNFVDVMAYRAGDSTSPVVFICNSAFSATC